MESCCSLKLKSKWNVHAIIMQELGRLYEENGNALWEQNCRCSGTNNVQKWQGHVKQQMA